MYTTVSHPPFLTLTPIVTNCIIVCSYIWHYYLLIVKEKHDNPSSGIVPNTVMVWILLNLVNFCYLLFCTFFFFGLNIFLDGRLCCKLAPWVAYLVGLPLMKRKLLVQLFFALSLGPITKYINTCDVSYTKVLTR